MKQIGSPKQNVGASISYVLNTFMIQLFGKSIK